MEAAEVGLVEDMGLGMLLFDIPIAPIHELGNFVKGLKSLIRWLKIQAL